MGADGSHQVLFYSLPMGEKKSQPPSEPPWNIREGDENWFDLKAWSDASGRGRTDTLLRELDFESSASANSATEATGFTAIGNEKF